MPAYACPDLVSAAKYAGVKPVLVDFEHDRPWMSVDEIKGVVSEKVIAIVAVNFLGIPERMQAIRGVADEYDALVIEDSAQAFPVSPDTNFWKGDIVIVSFGRGKPVSLLGGGALLLRLDQLAEAKKVFDTTRKQSRDSQSVGYLSLIHI